MPLWLAPGLLSADVNGSGKASWECHWAPMPLWGGATSAKVRAGMQVPDPRGFSKIIHQEYVGVRCSCKVGDSMQLKLSSARGLRLHQHRQTVHCEGGGEPLKPML